MRSWPADDLGWVVTVGFLASVPLIPTKPVTRSQMIVNGKRRNPNISFTKETTVEDVVAFVELAEVVGNILFNDLLIFDRVFFKISNCKLFYKLNNVIINKNLQVL